MDADGNMVIADRVRELRRRRGMTQENLAEQSGLSVAVIQKIEQGRSARMETYHAIARVFGVRTIMFVAPKSPEPVEQALDDTVLADIRSAINPAVRMDGRPLYGTADGDEADLGRLRRTVSAMVDAYHTSQFDDLAGAMPALVRSAHHHVEFFDAGDDRQEALRLRAEITELAGRYLIQIRAHDLALIAAHTTLRDALEIGDTPLAAAAIGSQAWAMLRQGRFDEVERLCVTTADEIEPKMSTATPDELAGWGWLLLKAAGAAVRNNGADEAREYAVMAHMAGTRLRHQRLVLAGHCPFGPFTTAIMGPEIELLDDRPDRALELTRQIPADVGSVDTLTWNRHRLDVARAHIKTRNADKATEILTSIRREQPQWMRYQQYARDIVRDLLTVRSRMPSEEQRQLSDFMKIAD